MAETVKGGAYVLGSGKDQTWVDAEGKQIKAPKQQEQGGDEDGFNVNDATRAELEAEAERRGITVTRSEGEGAPLKEDYVRALS